MPRSRRNRNRGREVRPRRTAAASRPPRRPAPAPEPTERPVGLRIAVGLGAVVLAAAAVILVPRLLAPDLPAPPEPDLTLVEAGVRDSVAEARARLLNDLDAADRWAAYGATLLAHEFHEEAATAYRAAEALDSDDGRFPYLAARSQWAFDREAAEASALRAVERDDYAPSRLLAGQLAEDRGDAEAAMAQYRTLLDSSGDRRTAPPNEAAARFRLGRLLAADGDLEAALPLLERAAELAPQSGAVVAALARVYRRVGDRGKARAAAEKARGLEHDLLISDPLMDQVNNLARSVVGMERRAFAAEGAGRPEAAEQLLREMIEARPDSADLYYNLGNNLSRQGRNDEALASWAGALDRNPDHIPTLVNSAIVLAQSGELAEAERRCRRVLEIQPDHPGALSSLGSIAALGGRRAEALRWFERALELEPERAGTHDSIAQVFAAERRFADAIRHFRSAVAAEPFRSDYRLGLAASLASTGDFEEARRVANEGRRLGAPLPDDFLRMLNQAMSPGGR